MTRRVRLLTARRQRRLVWGLQAVMVAILLLGVALLDGAIVVNASVGILVSLLPALFERNYRVTMDVRLVLWITVAMFVHVLGTVVVPGTRLSVYSAVWWWDDLTHTLSATLVAAVGYASARAYAESAPEVVLPPAYSFAYLFLFVLAAGVAWELIEYYTSVVAAFFGVPGVLIQYGLTDTMVDLLYNLLGALVVALWGTVYLTDVVEDLSERFTGRSG